jgi:hypothetical protein
MDSSYLEVVGLVCDPLTVHASASAGVAPIVHLPDLGSGSAACCLSAAIAWDSGTVIVFKRLQQHSISSYSRYVC